MTEAAARSTPKAGGRQLASVTAEGQTYAARAGAAAETPLTKELAAQLLTTVAACMINNVAPTVEEAINEVDRVARTATADALAAEEQEVVQKRVALKYFGAAAMNQYTLFSFTSNMLLFRLNHSSCHAHGAPVEALQLAVVKPKLLYRRSLDCHELSLYGSINLNAVNLMSLLLMPLVQKFDVYAS